jgi:hypothetical protein
MSDQNLLTRREFTVEWVLAVLAGATITITGCGGDDNNNSPGTNPTPTPQAGDKAGVISANHGHTAIVTAATLASPTAVTINMRAQATHNHTLTLTAAEVSSIAANARVEKTSSTDDGHNHTVTFN